MEYRKTCTKCNKEKDINEFCVVKKSKDGRNTRCRECGKKASAEWRLKEGSAEKITANRKDWNRKNRGRRLELKKRYRERHPERARQQVRNALHKYKERYRPQQWRAALKRLYGLTPERFYEIQEEQNNRCAICGRAERDSRKQKLCIDHDHNTNFVRGLLCFGCNVILGNANDNPAVLRKAADYLEKSFEKQGIKCQGYSTEVNADAISSTTPTPAEASGVVRASTN